MKTASLLASCNYNSSKPAVELLLETDFTKEIRILFQAEQVMKRHQTPFPIVVEVVAGQIAFGVEGEILQLKAGDLISLSGGVPHDLHALVDSVVRLTLSTQDHTSRVAGVAANS